jgi:hypothetical protein
MAHTIKGTITQIGDVQEFSSGFTKKEMVIEEPGEYPNPLPVEAVKDGISKMDGFSVGDEVSADVFVNGREWEGRHFVNLRLAKIEKVESEQPKEEGQSLPF